MKKLGWILIAALFFIAACTEDTEETNETQEEHVVSVEVEEVTEGNVTIEKTFYGRAMPEEITPVMAQTMGEVEEVHVANGDRVEEDDILITIISFETGMEVEITAPADGQVSDLSASEGSILSTEEPVSMIVNLDELTITADVTATNVDLFEVDQEVDIHFSGDEDRSTATVVETSLLPGETGLYEVTLTAENANDWKAGMVATIFLTEETISDTLIIPTAALIEDDGEHYVFVVEDNRVTRTEVTVSNLQSDITAVDGEIEQGDLVVTSGQLTLSDGSQVIIVGEDGES